VILGVLDLNDMAVESPRTVAERIRAALEHIDADRSDGRSPTAA
jgi:5-methyltetrahydropteroyltriglutamate--homocysteine methyltransferase